MSFEKIVTFGVIILGGEYVRFLRLSRIAPPPNSSSRDFEGFVVASYNSIYRDVLTNLWRICEHMLVPFRGWCTFCLSKAKTGISLAFRSCGCLTYNYSVDLSNLVFFAPPEDFFISREFCGIGQVQVFTAFRVVNPSSRRTESIFDSISLVLVVSNMSIFVFLVCTR